MDFNPENPYLEMYKFLFQFIVVSLKDGMFNNANVLFRTKFVDGMSTVTRTVQHQNQNHGGDARRGDKNQQHGGRKDNPSNVQTHFFDDGTLPGEMEVDRDFPRPPRQSDVLTNGFKSNGNSDKRGASDRLEKKKVHERNEKRAKQTASHRGKENDHVNGTKDIESDDGPSSGSEFD